MWRAELLCCRHEKDWECGIALLRKSDFWLSEYDPVSEFGQKHVLWNFCRLTYAFLAFSDFTSVKATAIYKENTNYSDWTV